MPDAYYFNRELSWLDFNSRVLAQAEDAELPLLERLKFCAIYASNLDEFFMVRVAGLRDQVAAGITKAPPDGLRPLAQLAAIRDQLDLQIDRLERVQHDVLLPMLADEGIDVLGWDELSEDERKVANGEFEDRMFAVLTPLAVDPGHPFPYISNLSLNIAVLVADPDSGQHRFARVKVPPTMDRLIEVADNRFVPIEQVIVANLDQLFAGMKLLGGWPFRVTRNADLTLDEDADDLLEAVEMELRRRRFGRAIRLEVTHDIPPEAYELLVRELDLEDDGVFIYRGLIDSTAFWQLQALDRSDLMVTPTGGVVPARLRDVETSQDFFARIRHADVLLHHPYESFGASVTEFIGHASRDPQVLAIKITLYRTSGDSPIIDALIHAAEQGKQVAALVELKARFDEQNNITWARRLEDAGVHVVYGLVGLKIHTKTTLVVRDEPDGLRRYCHIGTGNYNPKTARIYEDVGLLTADRAVGDDLSQLFNLLTGYGRDVKYRRLFVAPHSLRTSLESLIDNETRAPVGEGHIIMKMNSLVDAELIDRLYAASQAGVRIDLIVRGICCLRPAVEGLSENITVRSLVGRYLEHSRLFYFAHGGMVDATSTVNLAARETVEDLHELEQRGVERFYLGSADLMPRNLNRRVEALVRVDDEEAQARLAEILDVSLADTALAWELAADGSYHRLGGNVSAHDELEQLASTRSAQPAVAETDDRTRRPPATPGRIRRILPAIRSALG